MSFNNWPLEILLQLLNEPVLRQHDLSSLFRVDKRFHEVASPLLYRDIKLDTLIEAGLRREPKFGAISPFAFSRLDL